MVPALGKSLFSFMSTLPLIHLLSCLTSPIHSCKPLPRFRILTFFTARQSGGDGKQSFSSSISWICKQVLPWAGLGASLIHHLSSCSCTWLLYPTLPSTGEPSLPAEGNYQTSTKTQVLEESSTRPARQASCRGCRPRRQLSSLPTSTSAGISRGAERTQLSPGIPRGVMSPSQTRSTTAQGQ